MVESPKRGLLAAYRRLLSPLVRILIRNGVDFEEFTEVAKRAYVDVASKDSGKTSGQKRISVLTGLSEEEISAVVERGRNDLVHSNLNQIAVTLSGWHTDFEFTGPYGVPIELKLLDDAGLDFKELVDRYVDDETPPSTLLKELVRVGTVVETEQGWFKPISRFYIPEGSALTGMDHLSRSVEEFVTTLDHNTQEQDPKKRRFERQTYTTDGIRPEDLPRFEEFAYTRARLLLEEIDNWVSQLDLPDKSKRERLITGLGIYHYISTESAEQKD
jgi:hypothetical protein